MYERDDPESSAELSSSGPSAERASEASSSSSSTILFLFLMWVGTGLLLPLPFLPTERHAALPLPLLAPASSLPSSPLLGKGEGRHMRSETGRGGGRAARATRSDNQRYRCCVPRYIIRPPTVGTQRIFRTKMG